MNASNLAHIVSDVSNAYVTGDMPTIDGSLTPDFVDHNPITGTGPDREGLKQGAGAVRAAFPDLRITPVNTIVDGSKVLYQFESAGTHQGSFAGVPATGKSVRLSAIVLARLEGDKIAERWSQENNFELLQQFGVLPGGDALTPWGGVPDVAPGHATTPEENKAVMIRHVEEIWNDGNLDAADELFHPDAVTPHAPLPPGPAGCKLIASVFRGAFPDFHMTIEDLVAEGDLVGARFHQTGTQQGELFGIPPTGRSVAFEEMSVVKIADGKIVSTWFETDLVSLMAQLGVGG